MKNVFLGLTAATALLLLNLAPARAQESSAAIFVTFTEPSEEGMAARVRDVAARMKSFSDQLENVPRVEIYLIHTPRELALRAGGQTSLRVVPSYVHGGFFLLSPLAWPGNPTPESIEHEVQQGLVLYAISYLAGGNRLPSWLEQGLLAYLTRQEFPPLGAGTVAQRAELLLPRFEATDAAIGYWAVKYLVEQRGGLPAIRQLLRLTGQRPDLFVDNLQLAYGSSVGELERAWRAWCREAAAQEEQRQKGGVQVGPLKKPEPPPKPPV